jgi:hypothetical protein
MDGARALDRVELVERGGRLARGYNGAAEGRVLIEVAIECCAASRSHWECRQVSHAVALAKLGLWRGVGAAIVEAFAGCVEAPVAMTADEAAVAELRESFSQL